ncbi:hypothetical protein QJS10_CPB13g01499 [Acorus calamus]|uniref:Transposase MuDR plant domain-containing protein n=1 Tax=Acorus calamus TaxID=4465 RepID=A0AAV9DIP5_ACOCL|nr:hypothetical protein QJS10_CPB13g01499 [Acorus calamus]
MVKDTDKRTYRLGRQKRIVLDKDYCNMDEIFEVGRLIKWSENDVLIEHNVSSSILPTPEDREAQNKCRYDSYDEGDEYENDYIEGHPQSFSVFLSDTKDDVGEQMHRFAVVFEDGDEEEPNIRMRRAHNENRHDPNDLEANRVFSESSYHDIHNSDLDNYVSEFEEAIDVQDEKESDIRVGVKFENIEALRMALRQHAIKKEFSLKYIKSEPTRVIVKCTHMPKEIACIPYD